MQSDDNHRFVHYSDKDICRHVAKDSSRKMIFAMVKIVLEKKILPNPVMISLPVPGEFLGLPADALGKLSKLYRRRR